jgi:hypothetical protein
MGYVYMQSSVSAYRPCALSPFINKKHIKWQNNYLQNIDTAVPAVSLADDEI